MTACFFMTAVMGCHGENISVSSPAAETVGPSAQRTDKSSENANFSLHVKNASLSAVLRSLSELTHKNIIFSGTLPGRITADLDHVTPEEALQIVLDTHGLVAENRGQTLIVWTVGENKDTTKTTYTYRLWYADSKEIVATLTPVLGDGKITCNQSANAVIISGTPGEVMQAREVLRHLDVPEKQVKVEAQVLAVNRAYAKELGIDWDFKSLTGSAKYYDAEKSGKKETNVRHIEVPEGYAALSYGQSITGHPYALFFQARLNALISEGKAKILAKPHVMTMNGHKAEILIGEKVPVLIEHLDNGVRTTTTEYRDAGIKLSYTPRINEKNEITAKVSAEVSTPYLVPEMQAYRIVTRQANTLVRLKSGDSLTIGGLTDRTENKVQRKVPLLGDIPLLGKLFQSEKNSIEETEIIIIIKADIINNEK